MWREAGLRWKDFLPEDVDLNKFVTEKVRVHSWLSVVILDVIQHCEGKKQESKAQVLTEESDY